MMYQAERLLIAMLLVLTSYSFSFANEECKDETKLFRLSASTNVLNKTSFSDSTEQGLSEKGLNAYLAKDYDAAQMYFKAALQNVSRHQVHNKNLIVLMTNLASTYREMGQLDQAHSLYKRALAESQKFKLSASESGYKYALRQYCGLLVKTGREDQAERALRISDGGNNYILQQGLAGLDSSNSSNFAVGINTSNSSSYNLRISQPQFNMRSGVNDQSNASASIIRARFRQFDNRNPSDVSAPSTPSVKCVRPATKARQMREARMRNFFNQQQGRGIEPETDGNNNAE